MNIAVRPLGQPAPGSAQPGNLYADLQSRSLWLGVDPATVDPAGSVLISDMISLMQQIDDGDAQAKAYTDSQVALRAPTTHTHTSSQITDFTAAVTAVATGIPSLNFTTGMIMLWSGNPLSIGVGPLAGWHICDGSAGTPDLRDRFVLGSGSRPIGSVTPNTFLTTKGGGSHVHTINPTSLTVAQLPAHNHTGISGLQSADHQHYNNFTTGTESANHTHTYTGYNTLLDGVAGGGANANIWQNTKSYNTGSDATTHTHAVQGYTGGQTQNHYHTIPLEGSGQSHTHTIVGGGGVHEHQVTTLDLRETIPFYALAYIMKL
jgi:hypothetical protein